MEKKDDDNAVLNSSTAPPIYILHSMNDIKGEGPLSYFLYNPEKIGSSIYTKKSESKNEKFQLAVDIDKDLPDGCDFLLGASYFAYKEIYFGVQDGGDKALLNIKNNGDGKFDLRSWTYVIVFIGVCVYAIL